MLPRQTIDAFDRHIPALLDAITAAARDFARLRRQAGEDLVEWPEHIRGTLAALKRKLGHGL